MAGFFMVLAIFVSVRNERQFRQEWNPSNINKEEFEDKNRFSSEKEDFNTEQIEKIAKINKNQSFLNKKILQKEFQVPINISKSQREDKKSTDFNYSNEYTENQEDNVQKDTYRVSNFNGMENVLPSTNQNTGVKSENINPESFINRMITRYKGVLIPNPYMSGLYIVALQIPTLSSAKNTITLLTPIYPGNQALGDIYLQQSRFYTHQDSYTSVNILEAKETKSNTRLRTTNEARQNWNWPGANFFPIYIRDPFLQMYYAFTNMIEYGPNSGNEGPCKLTPRPQGSRIKFNPIAGIQNIGNNNQVELGIDKKSASTNTRLFESKDTHVTDNLRYLNVEDIDIGNDVLMKFTINVSKKLGRGIGENIKPEITGLNQVDHQQNNSGPSELISENIDYLSSLYSKEPFQEIKQSPFIRNQILHSEEIEDESLESEKAEDINISNQGTKKVFNRENTGSGIFIHKLKVRQGGVAIAGPGGIATAGSGGTAIVGPNGVAYTHPDGLAIAGSGAKVVAVNPDIDLNVALRDSVKNGAYIPDTRVGKVVAVGPTVYYNGIN